MANPVLTPQKFEQQGASPSAWPGTAMPDTQSGDAGAGLGGRFGSIGADAPASGKTMTVGGTMTATFVLFALILITGTFGWMSVDQVTQEVLNPQTGQVETVNTTSLPSWLFLALIVGLGLGLVTAFVPKIARFTAPIYALAFGGVLGAISAVYNAQWSGIVVQAVAATVAVFGVMFFLYVTRIIKVTKKYVMVVVAATLGIMVMYLGAFVASLFGADIAFWNQPSALGIGISVVIVIVAALNLGLDFAFIEKASEANAPKYMEWYGAFGLTVTMVWLYLEILRLLSLLRQ